LGELEETETKRGLKRRGKRETPYFSVFLLCAGRRRKEKTFSKKKKARTSGKERRTNGENLAQQKKDRSLS